jgi:hypothetical protein
VKFQRDFRSWPEKEILRSDRRIVLWNDVLPGIIPGRTMMSAHEHTHMRKVTGIEKRKIW